MLNHIRCFTISFGLLVISHASAFSQPLLEEWERIEPPPAPEIATVTPDVETTALLIMDFNGRTCTPEGRVRCYNIIPRVEDLLRRARAAGMEVVYTHGPNMELTDFVPELAPVGGERVYQRPFDKFYGSTLEDDLRADGIDTLILAGTAAMGAVFATGAGAVVRDFDIIVPIDGMAADTAYEEQFVVWYMATANTFRPKTVLTSTDLIGF
jgi:nicotinamidase-related amidase